MLLSQAPCGDDVTAISRDRAAPEGGAPYRAAPSYEIQLTREYERPDPFVRFDGRRTGSSLFAAVLLHVVGQRVSATAAFTVYDRIAEALQGFPLPHRWVPPPRRDAALPNRMPGVHLPPQTPARAQYGSPVAGRYERAVRQADYRANWITPLQIGAPDVAFAPAGFICSARSSSSPGFSRQAARRPGAGPATPPCLDRCIRPVLAAICFGGLTGVLLASPPLEFHVSDSYFSVAHFHYTLFGTVVFAMFAGFYFWWPKFTGRMLDERLGKIHFWTLLVVARVRARPAAAAAPTAPRRRFSRFSANVSSDLRRRDPPVGAGPDGRPPLAIGRLLQSSSRAHTRTVAMPRPVPDRQDIYKLEQVR